MIETGIEIATQKVAQSRLPQVDFNNTPFGKIYSDHMFISDFEDGQWKNNRIVPFGNLSLSPAVSGLHYGQSIFEGLKAFQSPDGESALIFRPEANAKRLQESAKRICMPEVPTELFMAGLHELIDLDRGWVPKNENAALYIRPFLFAMDEYIGLKPSEKYSFIIFTSPVGSYYSEPVKVKVEQHYTRAAKGGTGYAKVAGNYAASLYPARLAQQEGYHQLLWTDSVNHKFIEESGTMNVLFVIDGKLVSIPDSDTVLPGITRKSILDIARSWGIEVEERQLSIDEIVPAIKEGRLTEMFGAGTAATVAHISLLHYDGVDYELPPVATREISNKLHAELTGLQRGLVEDKFNWVYKI
ncbi:branched-chain amino acid aminotransferase [Flammeovirgaceae bacterium SG7u.111]|nr:branched-chain amino acid aminotransferase [Flammeovirgaceae bacterium SG7u.132]WPO35708.1 branched-chain amino acid aminotransferase [Flammeovirgaceae bacterium SG7u.111]